MIEQVSASRYQLTADRDRAAAELYAAERRYHHYMYNRSGIKDFHSERRRIRDARDAYDNAQRAYETQQQQRSAATQAQIDALAELEQAEAHFLTNMETQEQATAARERLIRARAVLSNANSAACQALREQP